jgi:hypothetical protein
MRPPRRRISPLSDGVLGSTRLGACASSHLGKGLPSRASRYTRSRVHTDAVHVKTAASVGTALMSADRRRRGGSLGPVSDRLYRVVVATKSRTPSWAWAAARSAWRGLERAIEGYPRRVALTGLTPVSAYGVYRLRNAGTVSRFVDGLPEGTSIHLHALSEVDERLSAWTRSAGPGLRIPLLSELITRCPPRPGDGVIIFDDDVYFSRQGGRRFPSFAASAEFDVAQPAHRRVGEVNFSPLAVNHLSTARVTTFVEGGPVVFFSPRVLPLVFPLPDFGMGWGLDVRWTRLRREGFRFGVVDATPMVHTGKVGVDYATVLEREALNRELADLGVQDVVDLVRTTGEVWRPWQSLPPWRRP